MWGACISSRVTTVIHVRNDHQINCTCFKGPLYLFYTGFARTTSDFKARGPVDPWTRGPVDPWTRGLVDPELVDRELEDPELVDPELVVPELVVPDTNGIE